MVSKKDENSDSDSDSRGSSLQSGQHPIPEDTDSFVKSQISSISESDENNGSDTEHKELEEEGRRSKNKLARTPSFKRYLKQKKLEGRKYQSELKKRSNLKDQLETNNDRIRKWFESDNVIVFPRKALKPWDSLLRFNFLDYNLQNVGQSEKHELKKLRTKDTFVGSINQVKTTVA